MTRCHVIWQAANMLASTDAAVAPDVVMLVCVLLLVDTTLQACKPHRAHNACKRALPSYIPLLKLSTLDLMLYQWVCYGPSQHVT
jgi:hypothetical protein